MLPGERTSLVPNMTALRRAAVSGIFQALRHNAGAAELAPTKCASLSLSTCAVSRHGPDYSRLHTGRRFYGNRRDVWHMIPTPEVNLI